MNIPPTKSSSEIGAVRKNTLSSRITTAADARGPEKWKALCLRILGRIWGSRWLKIAFLIVLTPIILLIGLVFLPERYQFYITRPISRIFNFPVSSLLPLVCHMANDFEHLPQNEWLTHLKSIPPHLRFPVFNVLDSETRIKLFELMLSGMDDTSPGRRATLSSLREKTVEFYRLQDGPVINSPEGNRLFSEAGEDWLNSLTPEEKALAVEIHRQWFVPELTLRHSNMVWVLPAGLKTINEQFERYASQNQRFRDVLGRTDQESILLMSFPWDMHSPDIAAKYETDGLFVAPRRESCNCGTDVDCLPGTACRIPFPGAVPDHYTACHLMGVLVPCRGRCVPETPALP